MPHPTPTAPPDYDRSAIFEENGPFQPSFIHESVRNLMRAMPLDNPNEPYAWGQRRMYSALVALSALNPRDEIEVMLGVQAVSAYQAAAAGWYLGMNLRAPRGDKIRHVASAASAARTFDTMLKALERRQAKPLSVPAGRPEPRVWPAEDPSALVSSLAARCRRGKKDGPPVPPPSPADPEFQWSPEALAIADQMIEAARIEEENRGLDIANTEGILPGGGMIMPQYPTPQQEAYIARRLALLYKREYAENLAKGIDKRPKIRVLRTGDRIP